MKRISLAVLLLSLAGITPVRADLSYTTLTDPLAGSGFGQGTFAQGVSGNTIVGYYQDSKGKINGFSYNGSTYTALDHPLANDQQGTQAYGVSGNSIVGYYEQKTSTQSGFHGFIYNGSTYTTVDDPAAGVGGTRLFGISGNTVVGGYFDAAGVEHAFSYDGSTFTNFDDPAGTSTTARGIDGNTVVGTYSDANGAHGFRYDGTTFTNFSVPTTTDGTTTVQPTGMLATGISGNTIVGNFSANVVTRVNGIPQTRATQFGYLYDGSNFVSLTDPAAQNSFGAGTVADGISGKTVVGDFNPQQGGISSFEVTIPEPGGTSLFAIGAFALLSRRHRSSERRHSRFTCSSILVSPSQCVILHGGNVASVM
jgi:hypothetical protein